ncbi:MAG: class A beta-lactamase-related serine hydrolase [Chloroflexi bacterium]|nr:class A beta-lactamase-related serine hydrolase [Chloroflexota bacterium]
MKRGYSRTILIAAGTAVCLTLIAFLLWGPKYAGKIIAIGKADTPNSTSKAGSEGKNGEAKKPNASAKSKLGDVDLDKLKSEIKTYVAGRPGRVGVLLELDNGSKLDVRGSDTFPSASLIKVPIAIAVYNEVNRGKLKLTDKLTVPKVDAGLGGQVLPAGTQAEVGDLIEYMLGESDNASANALIDKIGMDKINKIAASVGAKGTTLKRKMLDLDAIAAGVDNVITPADSVLFLNKLSGRKLLKPKYCDAIIADLATNRDKEMIASLQDATVVHGSGAMSYSNGFLVSDSGIVKTGKGTYYLAVITKDQPSEKDGLTTVTDISNKIKATLDK